ncbi:MAG: hypothetical protein DLM57_03460 [Pseudonocardiales bacterium]|nr:MAG: hypothetical protein DLM57_03460 [Pseudonocardiales bacterium]
MPAAWSVSVAGETPIVTRAQWTNAGSPPSVTSILGQEALPMYVLVSWDSYAVPWAVVADDRHHLPPGPALSSLRAQHLLAALASGRSLAQVLREELEQSAITDPDHKPGINLDPLKRLEVEGSLLRKGRALAASLSAMQRRLERQVVGVDTLRARLAGPLGPEFVAAKVVEAFESGQQSRAEAVFTLAEIALAVGRVNWVDVVEHIDTTQGLALVTETLKRLDGLIQRLGDDPPELVSYARRAIGEARRCLAS